MVRGGPEPQVAATVRRVCDVLQPTTFLDVGANFGYYTWLVAELLPSAQVHSFEPDPANVALLRETLMRRGLQDRVTVHPAAVGETPGRSTFATDAMTGHRGHLTAVGDLEVPVVTLDSLDLRGPVLVKIDVEGGETEVLAGAQGLVESGVVFVVEAGAGSLARSLLAAAAYSLLDARTLAPLSDQSFEILAAPPALLERFV
jgi:FkbM family methyltransferase